ncbi:hypothetical protein NC981_19235 [Leptolyngbya sp. DQ-M1]
MNTAKRLTWRFLWLYFLARSAIDLSPLITQKMQAYALQQIQKTAIERLTGIVRDR